MSKQLAISTAFSVLTMAAFALSAAPDGGLAPAQMTAGAESFASAPAFEWQQFSTQPVFD